MTECASLQRTPLPKSILFHRLPPSRALILSFWHQTSFVVYLLPKRRRKYSSSAKKKNVSSIFNKNLQPWCQCGQSAPRQESDCTCKHLCQSAFVSMSHSLSHRWRHLSARALARLSEHSQINQCRKSPHKFQWKMKHQSTLSTIHSAWRQLFTVMGSVHHIWDWEGILIITQPLMEGQIPYPATMHTSSILILPGYLSWAYNNKKTMCATMWTRKHF